MRRATVVSLILWCCGPTRALLGEPNCRRIDGEPLCGGAECKTAPDCSASGVGGGLCIGSSSSDKITVQRFALLGCIEGACLYRAWYGECSTDAGCFCPIGEGCADAGTAGSCLDCALGAGLSTSCVCAACASACAGTMLCGGTEPHSDACAGCAIDALTGPACQKDGQFARCLEDSSCRAAAQRIEACRR